jgi:hypothetical protein
VKLTLGTTLWKRPRIELLTLDYYAELAKQADCDVNLVCAVSEDWAKVAAESMGWLVVETPNQPLGHKHNMMLSKARETEPDAFLLVGSDDWLVTAQDNVFDVWARHAHLPLVGLTSLWIVDLPTERALLWDNAPTIIGAGRLFRADVLNDTRWRLWPSHATKGLDGAMARKLGGRRWVARNWTSAGMGCIDFKSGTNIWSYDDFANRAPKVPLTSVLARVPDWMRQRLNAEWFE